MHGYFATAALAMLVIGATACSSSSTSCGAPYAQCAQSAEPAVYFVHSNGRAWETFERYRLVFSYDTTDGRSEWAEDCEVCGPCKSVSDPTSHSPDIACAPPSMTVRSTPFVLTVEPYGGGAALASKAFTPHGVDSGGCCPTVEWDRMTMTIP